tara:strand:+ start:301 stop:1470 length:1170 start_codon:yes stop_codon:yes gene_type:complete
MRRLLVLSVSALAVISTPVLANADMAQAISSSGESEFSRFEPEERAGNTRLDWSFYDEALDWFVLYMGPSLRQRAPSTQPIVGTHIRYGHDSGYRMEGNRVAFEYLEGDKITALTEYRRSLEQIGTELDLARLPRNEQLAFWLNLHNVAMIEQIALAYPVGSPQNIRIDGVPLDEARFITVAGVAMSPRDIRTRIVYPNWRDPRVIYGFFRGDIGGPSIQELAYTGRNVDMLLGISADEFVNSLRGTQARGDRLRVSTIYEEARPFYFSGGAGDLRAHLAAHAQDDVADLLTKTTNVSMDVSEHDIADLSNGERMPPWSLVCRTKADPAFKGFGATGGNPDCDLPYNDIPPLVLDFSAERHEKVKRLIREDRYGRVYVFGDGQDGAEVR